MFLPSCLNKIFYLPSKPWLQKILPGFFLLFLFLVVYSSVNAQTSSSSKRSEVELGALFNLEYASNVYSLEDLIDTNLDRARFHYKKLFARAVVDGAVVASERGCMLGLGSYKFGAATTDQETLRAYIGFDTQGVNLSPGQIAQLRYEQITLEGTGAFYACERNIEHQKLGTRLRWTNIQSFQLKRYQGSVRQVTQGTDTYLNEEWFWSSPQLEGLQRVLEKGRLLSFDINYQWRSISNAWNLELDILNVWSRVTLKQVAYLDRTLNAVISSNTIFQRGQVSPLVGRYGNRDMKIELPRLWSMGAGHQLNPNLNIGLSVLGVESTHQLRLVSQLGCIKLCNKGLHGVQVSVDEKFKSLAVGIWRNSWYANLGIFLDHSPSVSSLNGIQIGLRF